MNRNSLLSVFIGSIVCFLLTGFLGNVQCPGHEPSEFIVDEKMVKIEATFKSLVFNSNSNARP